MESNNQIFYTGVTVSERSLVHQQTNISVIYTEKEKACKAARNFVQNFANVDSEVYVIGFKLSPEQINNINGLLTDEFFTGKGINISFEDIVKISQQDKWSSTWKEIDKTELKSKVTKAENQVNEVKSQSESTQNKNEPPPRCVIM